MKKNKKYDCVKMMREIREKVNSEISSMNPEQILEYLKKGRTEFEKSVNKK